MILQQRFYLRIIIIAAVILAIAPQQAGADQHLHCSMTAVTTAAVGAAGMAFPMVMIMVIAIGGGIIIQ